MKRKYDIAFASNNDDNNDELNHSNSNKIIRCTSVLVEQPNTNHFDSNTREYWSLLVNAMRTSENLLYSETSNIFYHLSNKSKSFKMPMSQQLKQIQNDCDSNVYYYLVQYLTWMS
jgi:hypothetical protein